MDREKKKPFCLKVFYTGFATLPGSSVGSLAFGCGIGSSRVIKGGGWSKDDLGRGFPRSPTENETELWNCLAVCTAGCHAALGSESWLLLSSLQPLVSLLAFGKVCFGSC